MNRLSSLIATASIFTLGLFAQTSSANDEIPAAKPGASRTVFIDISVFSRKKRGAEKIDEIHAAHFAKGWTVVDMEVYTENGDLQGYFLTYRGINRALAE